MVSLDSIFLKQDDTTCLSILLFLKLIFTDNLPLILGFSSDCPTENNQFISVQSLSHVQFLAFPWTAAHQASLSITNSWSLLKLMSVESVMPSNHPFLCHPLLLPSVFPNIRVFPNELALCTRWQKYWSFSFSISPSNEY